VRAWRKQNSCGDESGSNQLSAKSTIDTPHTPPAPLDFMKMRTTPRGPGADAVKSHFQYTAKTRGAHYRLAPLCIEHGRSFFSCLRFFHASSPVGLRRL